MSTHPFNTVTEAKYTGPQSAPAIAPTIETIARETKEAYYAAYGLYLVGKERMPDLEALVLTAAARMVAESGAREALEEAIAKRAATTEWRTDSPECTGKPERWVRDDRCTRWRDALANLAKLEGRG